MKPLRAEGVHGAHTYQLQHKLGALYHEKEWWHHLPQIPELPGSEEANRTALSLLYSLRRPSWWTSTPRRSKRCGDSAL